MAWVYLILAGIGEVVGVMGMNRVVQKKSLSAYAVLIGGFALSFSLLNLALKSLPLGVAYAVWTGIGAAGATLVGMFFYGESKDGKRLFFIALIIAAVVGLRLST